MSSEQEGHGPVRPGAEGPVDTDWRGHIREIAAPSEPTIRDRVLALLRDPEYHPLPEGGIARALGVTDTEELEHLRRVLGELEEAGEVVREDDERFAHPGSLGWVLGRLHGNPRGFGFVVSDEPEAEDVHIGPEAMNGAMHGDRVLCRVQSVQEDGGHPDGVILRIVHRGHTSLVGNLEERNGTLVVVPDERRIPYAVVVPHDHALGATPGEKVVVTITRYPEGDEPMVGYVIERLGRLGEPGVDVLAIMRNFELPGEFPPDVLAEADAIPSEVRPEDLKGRQDLRALHTVTIDAEESRDLDDAVSLEALEGGGYRLGVHIADVSYYVREGSALDREALERGTSVYLVDRVIPMLPERLSNGICSLNPQVDRLTMSVFLTYDRNGIRREYQIGTSIIRTAERMTYTNVNRILEGDPEARSRYAPLVGMFDAMRELMEKLGRHRHARGAIDFDLTDEKVILDAEGHPVEIRRRERTAADQIVEEFMLAANEAVAEEFHRRELPFLYRVHEEPEADRLASLNEFLGRLGHSLKLGQEKFHPRTIQALLERVHGRPEEPLIAAVALRALRRARYSAESLGHFGLAAVFYSHFTSPIRRYPDLEIHRIIREQLEGRLTPERVAAYVEILPEIARHSSEREHRAEDAERASVDMKKVEYMARHVGEEFDGIVSGVAPFGMFVELENTCEGLVHVSTFLDDYYRYEESQYALVGERTHHLYRLADPVRVRVMRVDPERGQVELALAQFADALIRRQSVSPYGSRGASRAYQGGQAQATRRGDGAPAQANRVHAGPQKDGNR